MYGRFYGANNTNQKFVLSRPLRESSFWIMGRNRKYMHEEFNESDERGESSIASESHKSIECPRATDANCPVGNYCSNRECPKCKCFNCSCSEDGDLPNPHGDSCSCPNCREYADYTEHTNTAKGKGDSPRIRFGNELGFIKQTSDDPTDSVEHSARLSTGVTV